MPLRPDPTWTEAELALVAAEPLLRWFACSHLPPDLQAVSRAFAALAFTVASTIPRTAERTVALRKLIEAKDAAVRARLEAP